MNESMGIFEAEAVGDTLILTAQRDLRELEFGLIERDLRALAEDPAVKRVVVDLGRTDYFGSTALGMLTLLCGRVRGRGGRVAFCNLSAHEREILAVTGLGDVWPLFGSRQEAIEAVTAGGGSPTPFSRAAC